MNLQLSGLSSFTAKQTIFSASQNVTLLSKPLIDCSCSDKVLALSLVGVCDSLSIYISIYLLGKLSHVLCRFYHTLNSVSQFYNMALCLKLVAQTDNRESLQAGFDIASGCYGFSVGSCQGDTVLSGSKMSDQLSFMPKKQNRLFSRSFLSFPPHFLGDQCSKTSLNAWNIRQYKIFMVIEHFQWTQPEKKCF